MGSISDKPPLVVIVGQTASGKSALAMALAQRFNGEIIAADSRTIYKGMDIGTAKPTLEDRRVVTHHLIDLIEPSQLITVADFQKLATEAIKEIAAKGKLPIMVGGSGLYVDAVIYGFKFRERVNIYSREMLENVAVEDLQTMLKERDIELPLNDKNRRHLIGALQVGGVVKDKNRLRSNTLIIGPTIPDDELEPRILRRVEGMLSSGLEEEVRRLVKDYGWQGQPAETIGYTEFKAYFAGDVSHEQLVHNIVTHTRRYAKRQKTWFKRNPDIHWISNSEEAVDLVTTFLNKWYSAHLKV
jgi:tRNA dimethylallyltransferase